MMYMYAVEDTCGLVETWRTHNPKVVSSSPTTANVLWTWADHFTLLASLTREKLSTLLGEYYNLISADKLVHGMASLLDLID